MVELRGILCQLCRLRAASHCFAAQSPLRFAQRPRERGRLHAVEPAGLLAPLRFNMRKATHKG